jgi:hypothetical protein
LADRAPLIRNREEGLTSVGKGIPEREMYVAKALGQIGPRRNELGNHVGVAGREEDIRRQNHYE